MSCKSVIDKFKNKEEIYKEDFINSLMYDMKLSFEEAKLVMHYINNIDNRDLQTKVILLLDKHLNGPCDPFGKSGNPFERSELAEFLNFLRSIHNTFLINKKTTNIIEETMLYMIENLLCDTNGKIKYFIQAYTIVETTGKIFEWKREDFKNFKSPQEIQFFIISNMEGMINSYPKLTEKLLEIFNEYTLEKEDINFSFPNEKDSLISRVFYSAQ